MRSSREWRGNKKESVNLKTEKTIEKETKNWFFGKKKKNQ